MTLHHYNNKYTTFHLVLHRLHVTHKTTGCSWLDRKWWYVL